MLLSKAGEVLSIIKDQLAVQLSRSKFELLIRPLKARDFDGQTLTLTTSNEVLRGWLLDQYGELLAELAELICGRPVAVAIEVEEPEPSAANTTSQSPTIPALHLRGLRGQRGQPVRVQRGAAGGGAARRGVQPAAGVRQRGAGQDAPAARDRPRLPRR